MKTVVTPTSTVELIEAVRSAPRVLAFGAGTKPRLSQGDDNVLGLSTVRLSSLLEYEPDEYTFTALAGTRLRDLTAVLAEKRQYLPFDPPLAAAGATLGGTVAAGLSGPGRLRYGGVRDFILGIRFIDGSGRDLRLGGKVVKNAAGFDLPKFLVGSLGRLGVITELTFKVFPRPASTLTLRLPVSDPERAVTLFEALGSGRWEVEAADLPPSADAVYVRLAGPEGTLPLIARELLAHGSGDTLEPSVATTFWANLQAQAWSAPGNTLHKIALRPREAPALLQQVAAMGGQVHLSSAGCLAWVALPAGSDAGRLGLPALTLRGSGPLFSGRAAEPEIARAIKLALDPVDRFPGFA